MDDQPIDLSKYGELLLRALPCMIESEEEHDRMLTSAEALMDKGDALSPEERKLLELLVLIIEVFEREVEEQEEETEVEGEPEPHETLSRLLTSRKWEREVLNDIFGNPMLAAEVLAGRRAISKGQAKALGKLFKVPPKLFFHDY